MVNAPEAGEPGTWLFEPCGRTGFIPSPFTSLRLAPLGPSGALDDSAKPLLLPAMLLLLRLALGLLEASLPLPPETTLLAESISFPNKDFAERRAGKAAPCLRSRRISRFRSCRCQN